MPKPVAVEVRFWSKVQKHEGDNCWWWTGKRDRHGYGLLRVGPRAAGWERAHRVSWTIHNGPIPEGRHICHRCDQPGCVRPDHLYAGTAMDNVRDMVERKRHFCMTHPGVHRGEGNPRARLTWPIVRIIREDLKTSIPRKELARRYGVCLGTIEAIKSGRLWKEPTPC